MFAVNPRHRRSPFLRLTDEGTHALDAIASQTQRCYAALLTKLEDLDLPGIGTALRDLTAVVRAELDT